MHEEIERRYMPFADVEHRILPLLGGFLAKKVAKKLGQKGAGLAIDLLAKNPTGGVVVKALDDTGILKSLGVKQSGGWQQRLVKKLDEPVFDLGGGKKITVGQLSAWNLGTALSPKFGNDREAPDEAVEEEEEVEEAPKLSGTLVKYGDRADMGSFFEEIERGAFAPIQDLDVSINQQHQREKALARTGGAGLTLIDSDSELRAEFSLPDTQDGRDVAELINRGILRGLSVEMSVPPSGQRWTQTPDGKSLRTITRAKLHGLSVVDNPAYGASLISQRALEYALGVPETATEQDSVIWL